jgi:hypothetical protein
MTHDEVEPVPSALLEASRRETTGQVSDAAHRASRARLLEEFTPPAKGRVRWVWPVFAGAAALGVALAVSYALRGRHEPIAKDVQIEVAQPAIETAGAESSSSETMGFVRKAVKRCVRDYPPFAREAVEFSLRVHVAPNGQVTRVEADPPSELGTCVGEHVGPMMFQTFPQARTILIPIRFARAP